MAADLVERKVAVIVTGGSNIGVRTVMAATQTIPIVFTTGADPVAVGFVASLNRRFGSSSIWINVTPVTFPPGRPQ